MPPKKPDPVLLPNLGIYHNVPPLNIPPRGLQDCLNVRITEGKLSALNMGWTRYSPNWQLNGPVKLIDNYFDATGAQKLIFASLTDLYEWIEADDEILYLTPRYSTGTVAITTDDATVTGTGTDWTTAGIKAGDFICIGTADERRPTAAEQPGGPNTFWREIASVTDATHLELVVASEATGAGAAYTIRKTLTGFANDTWSTELFHHGAPGPTDWWIGTNGVDPVFRWNGTDTQVEVAPGFDFTCRTLLRWKTMMFYANLSVGGDRRRTSFRNSAIGEPFNVSTLEAQELIAHDGIDDLLSIFTLADHLVLYGSRTIVLVAFVGPPEYFNLRTVMSGLGPLGAGAIADFGDNHEFLGADAAYEFDGVSLQEVHYHVMREVIRRMPVERYDQIITHFSEETGEIWWIVPLTSDATDSSPEKAYSEHYLEEVGTNTPTPFTIRQLPATATGVFERLNTLTWDEINAAWTAQNYRWDDRFFSGSYPLSLFGDLSGKIYTLGTDDSQDGEPISSYALFPLRPAIDGRYKGCVTRVYPITTQLGSGSLGVKVHVCDRPGMPTTEASLNQYALDHTGLRFVNPFAVGRFYAVEFGRNGIGAVWDLHGYDTDVAPVGER
jgi:hypothetical protein